MPNQPRWRRVTIFCLVAILALGIPTLWAVSMMAPRHLLYSAILLLAAFALLLFYSWRGAKWAYKGNMLAAVIVLAGTFSSSTHFAFLLKPAFIAQGSIVLVGTVLQVVLLISSLKAMKESSRTR